MFTSSYDASLESVCGVLFWDDSCMEGRSDTRKFKPPDDMRTFLISWVSYSFLLRVETTPMTEL